MQCVCNNTRRQGAHLRFGFPNPLGSLCGLLRLPRLKLGLGQPTTQPTKPRATNWDNYQDCDPDIPDLFGLSRLPRFAQTIWTTQTTPTIWSVRTAQTTPTTKTIQTVKTTKTIWTTRDYLDFSDFADNRRFGLRRLSGLSKLSGLPRLPELPDCPDNPDNLHCPDDPDDPDDLEYPDYPDYPDRCSWDCLESQRVTSVDRALGAARRCRDRRLRAFLNHECMTVAMKLVTAYHHAFKKTNMMEVGVQVGSLLPFAYKLTSAEKAEFVDPVSYVTCAAPAPLIECGFNTISYS